MSGYFLKARGDVTGPVDTAGLLPTRLAALSVEQVAELPLLCAGRWRKLADVFEVQPLSTTTAAAPEVCRLEVESTAQVHRLGWGMSAGELIVRGATGTLVGACMSGGTVTVFGNTGALAGAGLRGGLLRIEGSTGQRLGGPPPGTWRGMTGGEIIVTGAAGAYAGLRQRGGLIAVAGDVGPYAGVRMLAGTLLIGGQVAHGVGTSMQRGTIICLNHSPVTHTNFGHDGPTQPVVWRLLARRLRQLSFPLPDAAEELTFDSHSGDLLEGGRGELLIAATQFQ